MKQFKHLCMLLVATLLSISAWGADPAPVSFSFGFAQWGESAAFSGTTLDEVSQTQSSVTCTYTRNTGSLYANTTSLRFYKANVIKFDAPSGYEIISITFEGSGWKNDVTTNVATCTSSTSTLSWSGNATSVSFTRPNNATSYATLSSASVQLKSTTGSPETTVLLAPKRRVT